MLTGQVDTLTSSLFRYPAGMAADVEPVVTWGVEFWQNVLISGLGTLGSLFVALILFGIARVLTKKDTRQVEAAATKAQVDSELLGTARDLRVSTIAAIEEDNVRKAVAALLVFIAHIIEVGQRSDDEYLQSVCVACFKASESLIAEWKDESTTDDPSVIRTRILLLAQRSSESLNAYILRGEKRGLASIHSALED